MTVDVGADRAVICPYCGDPAKLVGGKVIYPRLEHLHGKKLWHCKPCGAWVGCHDGTTKPLGRLANYELRRAKMAAHAAFDPLWKDQGPNGLKRGDAYAWLAKELSVPVSECHIGMFDESQCRAVVIACAKRGRQ